MTAGKSQDSESKTSDVSAGYFIRAYGLAHFGKSLFWYASEVLFAYFLTEISDIEPRYMGIVLVAGLVCGAVADLVSGIILRQRLSCAVQAARLQLFGAIISACLLILLFLGALVPSAMRFAYAMITGLGFRLSYALYDMPQNALLSLPSTNIESRTRVASLRLFFSGLAAFTVSAAIVPALSGDTGSDKAFRFLELSVILSLVAVLTAAGLWASIPKPSPAADHDRFIFVPASPKIFWSLPSEIWILVLAIFLISGSFSTFTKFEPYYAVYVLKSAFWGGTVIAAASLGMALSQPVWMALPFKDDRPRMMIFCSIVLIAAALAFSKTAQNPCWAIGLAFCFGAANGGIGMTVWAAFGDAVSRMARGREGLAYGLLTASAKISLAVGGLMIGESLGLIDYRAAQSRFLPGLMALPPAIGGGCLIILMMLCSRADRLRKTHARKF